MRTRFVIAAAVAFIASILFAFGSCLDGSTTSSVALAIISAGFSIAGGLALVAAAISKGDA
jgi:hypothetical protein